MLILNIAMLRCNILLCVVGYISGAAFIAEDVWAGIAVCFRSQPITADFYILPGPFPAALVALD
jgi:hypothetical protein